MALICAGSVQSEKYKYLRIKSFSAEHKTDSGSQEGSDRSIKKQKKDTAIMYCRSLTELNIGQIYRVVESSESEALAITENYRIFPDKVRTASD